MNTHYHFIGIGGIGMSGLATLLLQQKHTVTGSDRSLNRSTECVVQQGGIVYHGHDEKNIQPGMTVVYTTGIDPTNPEYAAAKKYGCTIIHRSELLKLLSSPFQTLAVTGTHGKTTTSALLTWVLKQADLDPSYSVGGMISSDLGNAKWGHGKYFVAESCESDGTFLNYTPYGAIITNSDSDHMDHYSSMEKLLQAFKTFGNLVKEDHLLLWCGDDPKLVGVMERGISYGFDDSCASQGVNFTQKEWNITFDVVYKGKLYSNVTVALTGKHNALNALAVFTLCLNLGVPESVLREALRTFPGVRRRAERKKGNVPVLFIDDYAHHPTEARVTLRAIRNSIGARRMIAVFQPHRYTRTKDTLSEYSGMLNEADIAFFTDVYSAGEPINPEITNELIASKLRAEYCPRKELPQKIASILEVNDVVVTLGAGDITQLFDEALPFINQNPPKRIKIGLVFGGASVEHEVSLLSARNIAHSFDPSMYELQYFAIAKDGGWLLGEEYLEKNNIPHSGETRIQKEIISKLQECDVLFPMLHGPFGEDGTIQGFFEILGIPYVGCNHRAAALCMDKALTKKLMLMNAIPTPLFFSFSVYDWEMNPEHHIETVIQHLEFPVFVKPVHLGSSVGVSKVEKKEDLYSAIDHAFAFDTHILVENGIEGRELEFVVIGNHTTTVFPPGEILTSGEFYDYEKKYGPNAFSATPKADLPPHVIEDGIALAREAYKIAGCTGLARIDFFLDENHQYWLNELNPLPGFTQNSAFPAICEANGLSLTALLDRLIQLALEAHRDKKNLVVV